MDDVQVPFVETRLDELIKVLVEIFNELQNLTEAVKSVSETLTELIRDEYS